MTNMVAWFRKGMGQTDAGAGALSVWADQTGLGSRDYAQATGASQPAIQGDGTVLFDGTSDFLKTPAFTLVQPYTRYLRLKQVSWSNVRYIADGNGLDTGNIHQGISSPIIRAYAGTSSAGNSDLAVGAWGSLAVVFNGASSVLQVGGGTPVTGNFGALGAGGLTLGASGIGITYGNIQVAEEIVYNVAHNDAERAAVIAYLNTK